MGWSLWALAEAHAQPSLCQSERGPGAGREWNWQSQWLCGIQAVREPQGTPGGTPRTLASCLEHPGIWRREQPPSGSNRPHDSWRGSWGGRREACGGIPHGPAGTALTAGTVPQAVPNPDLAVVSAP